MGPKEKSPGSSRSRGNVSEAEADSTPSRPGDARPPGVPVADSAAPGHAIAGATDVTRAGTVSTITTAAASALLVSTAKPTDEDELGLVTVKGYTAQKSVLSYEEQKVFVQTMTKGDVVRVQLLMYSHGAFHLRTRDAQVIERTRGEHSSAVLAVKVPGAEPLRVMLPRRPIARSRILLHDIETSGAEEHSIDALLLDMDDGVSPFRCTTWRATLAEPLDSAPFRSLIEAIRNELRLEPYRSFAVWPAEGAPSAETLALESLSTRLRQEFNILRSLVPLQVVPSSTECLRSVWSHALAAAQSSVDEAIELRLRASSTKNALAAYRALRHKGVEREPALAAVLAPQTAFAWPVALMPDILVEDSHSSVTQVGCSSIAEDANHAELGFGGERLVEARAVSVTPAVTPAAAARTFRSVATQVYKIEQVRPRRTELVAAPRPGCDEARVASGDPQRALSDGGHPGVTAAGTNPHPNTHASSVPAPPSPRSVVVAPCPQRAGAATVLPGPAHGLAEQPVQLGAAHRAGWDRPTAARPKHSASLPAMPLPRSRGGTSGLIPGAPGGPRPDGPGPSEGRNDGSGAGGRVGGAGGYGSVAPVTPDDQVTKGTTTQASDAEGGGCTPPAAVGGVTTQTVPCPNQAQDAGCIALACENRCSVDESRPGPVIPQSEEGRALLSPHPRSADPSVGVQGEARRSGPAVSVPQGAEVGDDARRDRHGRQAAAGLASGGVKGVLARTFPANFPTSGYVYYGVNEPGVELALPILSSDEGAAAVVKSAASGKKLKLVGQVPDNDLVMARTTANCIDLHRLIAEAPHLKLTLTLLTDVDCFLRLFNESRLATWKPKQHLSRGMAKHFSSMKECDAVEAVSFRHVETSDAIRNVLFRTWMKLHLVPKKSGEGRLIANAIPINELQDPPPDMGLPRIHDVIAHILRANVAGQTDGVSYFCQFELAPTIRPFFKAKLAGKRGEIHRIQLKRLPMGWKYAPAIAQHTSNWLVKDVGVAWVDNFVITGVDEAEYEKNREEFIRRLDRYNVEVDDRVMKGDANIRVLGVECDLKAKRYRMDPAWVEKRRAAWSEFTSSQRKREPMPLRKALEFFGAMIWATYTKGVPLWSHAESMAALSHIAKLESDYDAPHLLPSYALADIDNWAEEVCKNDWQELRTAETRENHYVFSDASDVGGAFVEILNGAILTKGAWRTTQPEHIFLAETRALARGAKASVDMMAPLYCTDNRPLHWCIVKGHSSSYPANVLLREVFGTNKPKSAWISTALNPVDGWSRGHYKDLDWNLVNAAIKAADAWGEASRSVSEANAACEERIRDVMPSGASMTCVEEK